MKLLLDTHIWLWSLLEPGRLSDGVKRVLYNPENERWLSPISLWEVIVLSKKKRINLDRSVDDWITLAMEELPIKEAPLTHEVAIETARLAWTHGDPADRFLAATARVFELTLVTADEPLIRARGILTLANR